MRSFIGYINNTMIIKTLHIYLIQTYILSNNIIPQYRTMVHTNIKYLFYHYIFYVKVVDYHKEFYRSENLCLIITGQIKPEDVFTALKPLEEKIVNKVI
jgi:hypothetical protein